MTEAGYAACECEHTHTSDNCYSCRPKMNYKLWLTKQKIEFRNAEKEKTVARYHWCLIYSKYNKKNKKLHSFNFVWLYLPTDWQQFHYKTNIAAHHYRFVCFFYHHSTGGAVSDSEFLQFFLRPFTSTSLCVHHKNYLNVVNRLIAFKWFLTVTLCIIPIPSQQSSNVYVLYTYNNVE